MVITTWALNAFGLYVTTVGILLVFLYLWNSPRVADEWQLPDGKLAYAKYRRNLIVAVGLLSAWLLLQNLALIIL